MSHQSPINHLDSRFAVPRHIGVPLAVGVLIAFLGAPLGLLWAAVSPHFTLSEVLDAPETTLGVQFSMDVRYLVIVALTGLIVGLASVSVLRPEKLTGVGAHRLVPNVTGAVAIGGIAAGGIAAKVGELMRMPDGIPVELRNASPQSQHDVLDLVAFRLRLTEFTLPLGGSHHLVINGGVFVLPVVAIVGLTLALWLATRSAARPVTARA